MPSLATSAGLRRQDGSVGITSVREGRHATGHLSLAWLAPSAPSRATRSVPRATVRARPRARLSAAHEHDGRHACLSSYLISPSFGTICRPPRASSVALTDPPDAGSAGGHFPWRRAWNSRRTFVLTFAAPKVRPRHLAPGLPVELSCELPMPRATATSRRPTSSGTRAPSTRHICHAEPPRVIEEVPVRTARRCAQAPRAYRPPRAEEDA